MKKCSKHDLVSPMLVQEDNSGMKSISTKYLKIILFIPYVNFLIFFIWGIQQIRSIFRDISLKKIIFSGAVVLSFVICVNIELAIIRLIWEDFSLYVTLLIHYVEGITIGGICLLSQKIDLDRAE